MSAKRWADEDSSDDSDEGSVEGESDNEAPKPSSNAKAPASTNNVANTRGTAPPAPRAESFIAYISNINGTASRMDVGRFFEENKCQIANLDVHQGHSKTSSATMEFKDAESLSIALSLNGEQFLGLPIRTKVFEVRGHQPAPRPQQQQGQGRGGGFRDAPRGNRNEEDRFPGRRQDTGRGDGGRGRGGSSRERPAAREVAPAPVPATRPKLNLAPRTLPVDLIGKAVAVETKPDIFGGGRPHDEIVYEEKKKTVDGKEGGASTESAAPESVFALNALKDALPAAASSSGDASADQPTTQGGDSSSAHAGRKGPPAGPAGAGGGRGGAPHQHGAGRGAAPAAAGAGAGQWSREVSSSGRNPTKGGRGGAVAGGGRGQSHGPGRTVEVTPSAGGSYVIEKPPSVDGTEGGARVRPPREEGAGAGRGFGGKQGAGRGAPTAGGRGAREPRQPRTANAGDASADATAGAVESGKADSVVKEEGAAAGGSRPKSGGAASGKLFSKAMDQASSGGGKASKKAASGASAANGAGPTDEEKFNKAQEKIANSSSSFSFSSSGGAAAAGAPKKMQNAFAALLSDSEDE